MRRWLLVIGGLIVVGILFYAVGPIFMTSTHDDQLPIQAVTMSEPVRIMDTPAHPAEGTVRIIESEGRQFVRYENFKTLNGPDLYVYLTSDINATAFIDLGRLKATEGNINYEIPAGTDVTKYPYVLVWCRAFGVLFNSAHFIN